jgi:hypothetical protein
MLLEAEMQKSLTFFVSSAFPCPCLSKVTAVSLQTLSSFTVLFALSLRQYDLRIDVKRLREISIQNIKRNRKC